MSPPSVTVLDYGIGNLLNVVRALEHHGARVTVATAATEVQTLPDRLVLPGVGAYQSYSFVQRELGAARTGLILYLGPIYSALVAWALLGEQPRWYHAVGAALILPGIWLATRPRR